MGIIKLSTTITKSTDMYYICGLIFYNMIVKKHFRNDRNKRKAIRAIDKILSNPEYSIEFSDISESLLKGYSTVSIQKKTAGFPLIQSIIEEQRRINIIEANNALLELNEGHDDFINKITEFQNYKTY